jgi:heme exporter protein B
MIARLLFRDLRRGLGGSAWLPIAFFVLVAALVPFAIGPDARLLAQIGPGILWIAALTAALMPIERLVEPDRADGTLDQLSLAGLSEEAIVLAKIAAHWLSFAPLLMLAALPAAALLNLDAVAVARLELSLLVGTPGLAALSVAIAAMVAGLPRAGTLIGLLLFPLAVPLLIFAAAYLDKGGSALLLEGAASLLLLAASPFAGAAAIRAART